MNAGEALMDLELGDWIVVGVYAVAMFVIAAWAMRRIKDAGGFLLGKRKIGLWMLMGTGFAGGTSANHPMGVAAATYKGGLSGMWLSLTWMFVTPFFWIFPPVARRMRVVTIVDMMNLRFGKLMGAIYKFVAVLTMPISMGLGIKSGAIVVEVMTGGAISEPTAIFVLAIPTLVYTLMGGVVAAYATDVLQGVLIVILSFLMIPFAISRAGGLAQLDAGIDDQLTQLVAADGTGFGGWWVAWFLVGCLMSAPLASMAGSLTARNEMVARLSIVGGLIKRFCTIGWGLAGLFAIALYSGNELLAASPDKVFPYAAGDLLPVVLRGLMVASVLGAVMSSLEGSIIKLSGLLTKNIYEEFFVRDASAKHYLVVTRAFAALVTLAGCYFAMSRRGIVDYVTMVEPMAGLCGVAVLFSFFWRRLTKWGAIASVFTMFPLFWVVMKTRLVEGIASLPWGFEQIATGIHSLYTKMGYDLTVAAGESTYLPVEISYPMYLVPGIAMLIAVSLCTRQHNQRHVDEYYARLDTPLGQEHRLKEMGFHEDDLEELDHDVIHVDDRDARLSTRLILVDFLRLPKLIKSGQAKLSDYKVDFIGLVASVAFVLLFLAGVQRLGAVF